MSEERPHFICPQCGRISYHPEDIANSYCGACHEFASTTCPMCGEPCTRTWVPEPVAIHTEEGLRYAHRECSLREVIGGIGHLIAHDYWCGEPRHDPDAGLSYRQSAKLVDAFVAVVGVDEAASRG